MNFAWRLLALAARLGRDRRGGIATTAAIAIPALALLVCGGIDLAAVNADRAELQAIVDAAALDAAKQIAVADSVGVEARARAFIDAQTTNLDQVTYSVTTTVSPDRTSVTIDVTARRTSFFANMLPPGGWTMDMTSTAVQMGRTPLCVLTTGSTAADEFDMRDQSRIQAPACLIQANSDITVSPGGGMAAAVIQAAGLATGPISPAPQTDALPIEDPFASMNLSPALPMCLPTQLIVDVGVQVLLPGIHCGSIVVRSNATLTLLPGDHFFVNGTLQLKQNSTITGDDVALVFDRDSEFQFQDSSLIRLRGRRTGQFAGFVVATTRDNRGTFEISSDSARELLGTVYIPGAKFLVTGTKPVADQSAWTVIVAQSIQMRGSPSLVINANYAGSSVPVPTGVGPRAGAVRLAR